MYSMRKHCGSISKQSEKWPQALISGLLVLIRRIERLVRAAYECIGAAVVSHPRLDDSPAIAMRDKQ